MFASDAVPRIALLALVCLAACDEQKNPDNPSSPGSKTAYNFDEVITFGQGGTARRYIRGGWGEPEKDRTWTNGSSASLRLTPPATDEPLRLRMKLAGFTNPPALPYQPVQVYVNDERVADWQVSDPADFIAIIPQPLAARERLIIELRMPLANSPKALGIGEDVRMLGVSCFEAVITRTTVDVAQQAEEERRRDPLSGLDNVYILGTLVYLSAGGAGQRYKTSGWHTAEKNHTWIGSDAGVLDLVLRPTEQPLKLRMRVAGMIKPPNVPMQPTQVFVNGGENRRLGSGRAGRVRSRDPAGAAPRKWNVEDRTAGARSRFSEGAGVRRRQSAAWRPL